MWTSRWALAVSLGCAVACAAKKPPPPMIETQAADVGGRNADDALAESDPEASAAPTQQAAPVAIPPGEGPKPLETQGGGPVPAESAPRVTLLKPGAEPRRIAKHTFRKGAKQSLRFASKSKITGISLPLPNIEMKAPIDIRIVEVQKGGDAKFNYSAGPFAVSQGAGGGGLGGMLGGLAGGLGGKMPERVVASGWVTPQGIVREFKVEQGAQDGNAPVEVGDAFPSEAIGIGAEWQVDVTLDEKDGPVNQTSVYELLSFAGNTVKVNVRRTQQPVSGSTGGGSSQGTLSFTLGQFYATGRSTMDKAMKVSVPGMDAASLRLQSEVNVTKR